MILQLLLDFLLNEYNDGALKPIISLLSNSNFDLKTALKNAKPADFAPLIKSFLSSNATSSQDISVFSSNQPKNQTLPIENFADSQVLSTLQAYFSN